ncbi:MAG: hypothetical protein EPN20_09080 [Magnetospirillum sp.]|nr:MAG: hypothetical protein EPN20_09080 [Magnetospirillum sp.]
MTTLRILSLGAGVQSTTLALMMAHGEVEPVDHAIFADTGCEPGPVYEHLRWLMSGNVPLPFPIHIVSAGNLIQEMLDAVARKVGSHGRPPLFVAGGKKGRGGKIRRQCTGDYKIDPIRKKTRELLGLKPRQRVPKDVLVEQVVGISWDEKRRARPAWDSWIEMEWPLIEKRMTRGDCLEWIKRHGYPTPPRSACTICPMRKNAEWRWLRDNDPKGWAEAVATDHAIRGGMRGIKAEAVFLHRSLIPLDRVDLTNNDDRMGNLFNEDCQGMCGL